MCSIAEDWPVFATKFEFRIYNLTPKLELSTFSWNFSNVKLKFGILFLWRKQVILQLQGIQKFEINFWGNSSGSEGYQFNIKIDCWSIPLMPHQMNMILYLYKCWGCAIDRIWLIIFSLISCVKMAVYTRDLYHIPKKYPNTANVLIFALFSPTQMKF